MVSLSRKKSETNHEIKYKKRVSIDFYEPILFILLIIHLPIYPSSGSTDIYCSCCAFSWIKPGSVWTPLCMTLIQNCINRFEQRNPLCVHGFCSHPPIYADDTQISTWSPDISPEFQVSTFYWTPVERVISLEHIMFARGRLQSAHLDKCGTRRVLNLHLQFLSLSKFMAKL